MGWRLRWQGDIDEVIGFCTMEQMRKVVIEPTWSEGLYRWLTSPLVAGLLLLLGFGGLYLEIKTPGVGLPGLIGVIALAIFFGSHLVIGLADWIDLLLVTVGLALLIAEVFFIPGFGLAGVSGIACLAVGFYLSLTRVVIPQYSWDFDRLEDAGKDGVDRVCVSGNIRGVDVEVFPEDAVCALAGAGGRAVGFGGVYGADGGAKRCGLGIAGSIGVDVASGGTRAFWKPDL